MDSEEHLEHLIPHRLNALAILVLMLEFRLKWEEPKPMQIFVEGNLQFEGLTSLFTNPVVEVGILHIRALLEFLGLKSTLGSLASVGAKQRRTDDAAIELLTDGTKNLSQVSPAQAGAIYPEDPAYAQACLHAAINAANKGMAHLSTRYSENVLEAEQLLLAARLTQQLVDLYVYQPLSRERPPLPIEAQRRE